MWKLTELAESMWCATAGHPQARLSPQMTGRRAHSNAAACVGNCLIAELYTIRFLWQHHQLTPRDKCKGLGCLHSEHCGCSSVGPRTAGVGSRPRLTHDKGPGCSQPTQECRVGYSASPVKTSASSVPHLWGERTRWRNEHLDTHQFLRKAEHLDTHQFLGKAEHLDPHQFLRKAASCEFKIT